MKKYYIILGALQAFTAIGAIPAGYGLLKDTSGISIGMSTEMLANSPFDTFFLPGLFLLLINGIATLVAAILSFTRNKYAGYSGLLLGIALLLWIIIQVWWISLSHILQPVFFIIALADIILSWKIIRPGIAKGSVSA